ncbi:hypothetical protein H5V45_01855 [Nocardioides sp. KIGAM211]|uniref:Uncharacterized protein n=1 Tax=Nocardioides luti TaxID=2761101 RepID=A0A7X0V8W3_9ACTN|nr:hypothetical protein [Nocardioides luti]MBB6626054.1 hypothetical protein [Nocardioides luti]
MSGPARCGVYAGVLVVLVVVLDPRTWGASYDTHGDEIGIVHGAQAGWSLVMALSVLAAIVVTTESILRSRSDRRPGGRDERDAELPARSWYD